MNVTMIPVESDGQIETVAQLAKIIWTEHYAKILSVGQVAYMLKHLQSGEAIREQLKGGYRYYLMHFEGQDVGYLAIKPEEGQLFLSKIYVLKAFRNQGIATRALAYLTGLCKDEGWDKIWLTVNKNNTGSIAAYEKRGFVKARTQVEDIGEGYVMDDYIMEKIVD